MLRKGSLLKQIGFLILMGLMALVGVAFTCGIIRIILIEIEKAHGDYRLLDYTGLFLAIAFSAFLTFSAIWTIVSCMGRGGRRINESWSTYLEHDERILWEGRPATGIRFRKADAYKLPVSLIGGGVLVFWDTKFTSVFSLFGGIVVLSAVGRLPWDAYKRRHTRYALTYRRALIATSYWDYRTMRSFPITNFITYRPGREATIILETEVVDDGDGWTTTTEHGFEFIQDGSTVYDLIEKIQTRKLAK